MTGRWKRFLPQEHRRILLAGDIARVRCEMQTRPTRRSKLFRARAPCCAAMAIADQDDGASIEARRMQRRGAA